MRDDPATPADHHAAQQSETRLPTRRLAATFVAMGLEIVAVDPLEPAQCGVFEQWAAVAEASDRAEFGDRHTAWSARELREKFRDQSDERQMAWAGSLDGAVVGQLSVRLPVADNTHRAEFWLNVHPDHRRRGVGSALLDVAERAARDEGRDVAGCFSEVAVGHDDAAARFAARHGYAAAQVELRSDLDLPMRPSAVGAVGAEAQVHSAGYETLTSWDGLPDEWLDDRARLSQRMSTDVPLGGIAYGEERWDAERVRRAFERAKAQGRRVVETVAREKRSGTLVAYSTLCVAEHTRHIAYQWDTLVLREHRGHRLGMLVKLANLQALTAELPGVRRIVTFNAEENAPMLRVNRAMGFVTVGRMTAWQKRLAG